MSLNLYPDCIQDRTPDLSGVDAICEEIKAACEGFGTDEGRLLKAMGSQSPETRCKVHLRYKELYDKDLIKVIKSEAGGRRFGTALQFLSTDPVSAECYMLKHCGRQDEKTKNQVRLVFCSILCGRTNAEMTLLKKKYFEVFSSDLGQMVDSAFGPLDNTKKLVVNCLQAMQEDYEPEEHHTEEKVKKDVAQFYEDGQGRWGADVGGLFKILCRGPPEHLKAVDAAYKAEHEVDLFKVFDKELNGEVARGAKMTLGMKINVYEQVAKFIDEACKGFGTDELLLTTVLIRYQPIMKQVAEAHVNRFEKTIEERIKSECRGDYEALLLEILAVGLEQ